MHWIKFIHVMLGVALMGGVIANYFYISLVIKTQSQLLFDFALKRSLLVDCIFFMPAFVISFVTGTYLVLFRSIPFDTPWIISAYTFLTLSLIFWLILFAIKTFNYAFPKQENTITFSAIRLFHVCNIIVIGCMILIVNDAVRKATFIPWQLIFR